MRIRHSLWVVAAVASAALVPVDGVQAAADVTYTVVAEDGAAGAAAAIAAAGGRIVARNTSVGTYTVAGPATGFIERVAASDAVVGATRSRPLGAAPRTRIHRPDPVNAELRQRQRPAPQVRAAVATVGMDPLDSKLWGLRMVRSDLARRVQPGSRKVTVGILDTGLDATNPDLATNFSASLSRNFAKDIPELDGPCEVASCLDPVGTDDGGHGTHVAGTIGAAADGFGISGVAPNVTLVELKGGQDAGYFFLQPVVNALTYAGDAGLDVVNMSFYVDPWAYNCLDNPADSPEARIEQRTILTAMNRALTYARGRGVTLIAALGNGHENLGSPRPDASSPDYPSGAAYTRTLDNSSCFHSPVEGPGVLGISGLGPSGRKADYSNYGREQISLAAPGGWYRDGYGTSTYQTYGNTILSAQPKKVLQRDGAVDAAGNVTTAGASTGVEKRCKSDGRCGYYGYLQGTSMAAPHASAVAALVVSQHGSADPRHTGTLQMAPSKVEQQLYKTAARHACPTPTTQRYTDQGRSAEYNAYCAGSTSFNGFYGYGIVDAYAAVITRPS